MRRQVRERVAGAGHDQLALDEDPGHEADRDDGREHGRARPAPEQQVTEARNQPGERHQHRQRQRASRSPAAAQQPLADTLAPPVSHELPVGVAEILGDHPDAAAHRHEAGVPAPARHDVQVQVVGDAGARGLAEVQPEVEPMRLVDLAQRLARPAAPAASSPPARRRRGRRARRRARLGATIACPEVYGIAIEQHERVAPRQHRQLSAPPVAAAQKMQPGADSACDT